MAAALESWNAELGKIPTAEIRDRVNTALGSSEHWVLIGGPPCQAFSLVGRSRNKGIYGYKLENDPKAHLYLEYLQLIADFWPAVFIMENVRGLLSARLEGELVFNQICADLVDPSTALKKSGRTRRTARPHFYTLNSLNCSGLFEGPDDFLVRCESYGIPQSRHRVIVVGIRDDINAANLPSLERATAPTVEQMIADLPAVRSGLSGEPDCAAEWVNVVLSACRPKTLNRARGIDPEVRRYLAEMRTKSSHMSSLTRGAEFVPHRACIQHERAWFVDDNLGGICNHSTRAHIEGDLHRYLFAAAYAEVYQRSPELKDFPPHLLPDHANVPLALKGANFADRFRVQHRHRYSTTVTSHISKDGHYYIHYKPEQCRSLTVREAARLQTFPDNYCFVGPRTAQYAQVGNAVPPLLAKQIAACVAKVLS